MSTRKKRHLIAGTIIGGLLLAATTQTGNSFALSNTSSPNSGTTTDTSQQAASTTDDSTSTGDTPNTPPTDNDAEATGSTATQSANDSTGVTSSANDPSSSSDPSTQQQSTPQTSSDTSSDPSDSALANNSTATNNVNSTAQTGNAGVTHTTTGGDATSGNASATTTLVNSIASSSNLNNGDIQTFNYNINGTQNGNVVINPDSILASAGTDTPATPTDCTTAGSTTTQNNSTINNLANLLAQTGNANVSDNGGGGNATSGNATTEANIVNMIQDLVSSDGAFLGVININGDLNGNIEIPASDISALLTPTQSGGTASGDTTATNNTNVNNNVTLTAITGTAAVTNNGEGGNATSGNASTILNSCNLIGSNIVGGNLLLVFVNVMGQWYGALLSEPAGDTTATLGDGITQDSVQPSGQTTATNNSTINNDINLTSISGNATVANNGVGGNATTGDATAIADITNILGSQINLSGWLGILIINVYGTWNGGLVIQPTATTTTPTIGNGSDHPKTVSDTSHHSAPVNVGDGYSYYIANPPQSFDAGQFNLASAHVLGASTTLPGHDLDSTVRQAAVATSHNIQPKHLVADFILAGLGLVLAITGGITRFFANRRSSSL